jgi:SAM-dependent methyltransferase
VTGLADNRYSNYDNFAWVYNKHWGMRFTPGALAVLDEHVLPGLPPDAAVLDLCCGTGQLAGVLSGRGCRVTGVDGSREMLRFAGENAPEAEFILDDARTFSLPPVFDLVTSFFDSLNHVMTLEELAAVFRNVRACLKDGGIFLFDMNLEYGYLANWKGYNGIIEDDHVCLFPLSYDAGTHVARFDATILRLDEYWYRSEVHLTQKCYPVEEVRAALAAAGLTILDVFDFTAGSGRSDIAGDSLKAFFLCRKL